MSQSKLLRMLNNRTMKKNQSNCILLFGKKGAGKSYLAIRFGQLLDPAFTLERVVFSPESFFELLKTNLPFGSVIVYDEIGVGTNTRDAQTNQNKHMSFIAQTIRPMGITVLFTTISWGLVDNQVRNMMDFAIKVEGHQGGITNFKFFVIEPRSDKPYPDMKHLVFAHKGSPTKYVLWKAQKPEGDLAPMYEKRRMDYLGMLTNDANMTVKDGERHRFGRVVGHKRRLDLDSLAAQVMLNPEKYKNGRRYQTSLIQADLKIGRMAASNVIQIVKKRGKI